MRLKNYTLWALLIVTIINGATSQILETASKAKVEFSKLDTAKFQQKCLGLKVLPIKIEESTLGYACIPLSAKLCSQNSTTCEGTKDTVMSDLYGLLNPEEALCCMPKSSNTRRQAGETCITDAMCEQPSALCNDQSICSVRPDDKTIFSQKN